MAAPLLRPAAALAQRVAHRLQLPPPVANFVTAQAADENRSIPFLSRYRAHMMGGMSETQLTAAFELIDGLREGDAARERAAKLLADRGLLTADLRLQLEKAATRAEVADIYAPFKVAKQTKMEKAREAGLAAAVNCVLGVVVMSPTPPGKVAPPDEPAIGTTVDSDDLRAINGLSADEVEVVLAAITEAFYTAGSGREAVDAAYRRAMVRSDLRTFASQRGKKKLSHTEVEFNDLRRNFENYADFTKPVRDMAPHQTLALLRGEAGGFLKLDVNISEQGQRHLQGQVARGLAEHYPVFTSRATDRRAALARDALQQAFYDHLIPSGKRRIMTAIKNEATVSALVQFRRNLRSALLARPLELAPGPSGQPGALLAVDPGFAHGCKFVVLSGRGNVLETGVFYHHRSRQDAGNVLPPLMERHYIRKVVIGDGTAYRETEAAVFAAVPQGVEVAISSECGASVYSASKAAVDELGDMEILFRGAVSIGRRVLDPLAELVKIPPQSIGVGMYQHDIDQRKMASELKAETNSVVASVGVNINTASTHVLQHVPGVTPGLATRIAENAPFDSRTSVAAVRGITAARYQQMAGFVRVPTSKEALDNTIIHPEVYPLARRVMGLLGALTLPQAHKAIGGGAGVEAVVQKCLADPATMRVAKQATRISVLADHSAAADPPRSPSVSSSDGDEPPAAVPEEVAVIRQVVEALSAPVTDPRGSLPYVGLFRDSMRTISDVVIGERLSGIVENVVAFGAFVECGVGEAGLAHVSAINVSMIGRPGEAPTFASGKAALELLSKGDVVTCEALKVEESSTKTRFSVAIRGKAGQPTFDGRITDTGGPRRREGPGQRRGEASVDGEKERTLDAPLAPPQKERGWVGSEAATRKSAKRSREEEVNV